MGTVFRLQKSDIKDRIITAFFIIRKGIVIVNERCSKFDPDPGKWRS